MQHPFPAANIASALIKSLGPYLDRCCVEHYPLETESYSSRLQFTKNAPSKPSSLKDGVDPHTSKFCDIIVKTFSPPMAANRAPICATTKSPPEAMYTSPILR